MEGDFPAGIRQAIAVLKGIHPYKTFHEVCFRKEKQLSVIRRKPADKSAIGPAEGFLFARYFDDFQKSGRASPLFPQEPKVFGDLRALASNEVNFAKRPLAGIYAKLTKLRDNKVVAMV